MAAESPRKRLRDEATCSVCLDFFTDPVMLDCGHNFCHTCIEKCWRNSPTDAACPECREKVQQGSLKPNRQLANMVEILKELSLPVKAEGGGGKVCEWHQEPQNLFCKDDEAPICVVCERSEEHRAHNVVLLQEAAREYKNLIFCCLKTLEKERETILACRADTENKSQALLKQMEAEREKAVVQFQQLRHFLEEQEKLLLVQVDEVKEEIARERDEHLARLSEKLSAVERSMQEMEVKQQQPVIELLQDIGSTLERCEKNTFEKSLFLSPALKWRIWDFCDINPILEGFLKQFQDTLIPGLQLKTANVSLDPDTAHPWLILSEDHKSAKFGEKGQMLPNNPERFDNVPFVFGREGFTEGRHFWEVGVGSEGEWSLGVARKSVRRKGEIFFGPEEGIWSIWMWNGEYRASHSLDHSPLSLSEEPKRIRVSLNYDGGRVAFYDADTAALIYAYSAAPFSGETLSPLFLVWGKAHLTLSP